MDEGFLDYREAAGFLKRSVGGVRNLVSRGVLPHFKTGGKVLFRKSQLTEWVESQAVPSVEQVAAQAASRRRA